MVERLTQSDMSVMLELVQEYTQKLRAVSDQYATARYRRIQLAVMMAATIALFGTLFLAIPSVFGLAEARSTRGGLAMIAASITLIVSVVSVMFLPASRKVVFDAHNLASIVENLVRTVSQYNEHTNLSVANRFEVTLRLAEADAALTVYHQVFRKDGRMGASFP